MGEGSIVSWVALFGAGGTLLALVSFWLQRGKEQQEAMGEAKAAREAAASASNQVQAVNARVTFLEQNLHSAQLEQANKYLEFADKFASNKDLAAVDARVGVALETVKTECREINRRLDSVLDHLMANAAAIKRSGV